MKKYEMVRAVLESGVKWDEQLLLIVMIDHLPTICPGKERLAAQSKMSQRQVARTKARLLALGIVIELENREKQGLPSVYGIDLSRLPLAADPLPNGHRASDRQSSPPMPDGHGTPCPMVSDPLTNSPRPHDYWSPKVSNEDSNEESGDSPQPPAGETLTSKSGIRTQVGVSSPSPKKAKPRGSRFVPDDWQPNDSHRDKAAELGVFLDDEARKFRDWEFKTPKTNFDLAFHRWLNNATPRQRHESNETLASRFDGYEFG